ncbi:MAG: peptidoglycan DD-metalloendopeptidase family protein [Oleispira sp.]
MFQTATYVSIIALCVVMTGCLSSREFISTEEKFSESKKATGFHIVEKGDTLFSIAWTYGWDYHELASTNSIAKPYVIYGGQKIDIANPPLVKKSAIVTSAGKSSKPRPKQEKPANKTIKAPYKPQNKPSLVTTKGWKWPAKGKVIDRFSAKNPQNKGIDISGKKGESVSAAAAGTVVYAGKGLRGYGNLVIIKHDTKFLSAYAHTSRILVREKEKIKAGQIIAEIGSTGTNRVKLHFEIRRNGRPVDPLQFLPKRRSGGG